jgi:hypothetical protein
MAVIKFLNLAPFYLSQRDEYVLPFATASKRNCLFGKFNADVALASPVITMKESRRLLS